MCSQFFEIEGGHPLKGEVTVSGAKNAANKMLVASMLSAKESVFANVPDIGEVDIAKELVGLAGAKIREKGNHKLTIQTHQIRQNTVPEDPEQRSRLPILMLGPLLHRAGEAILPMDSGGDRIGKRPINFHLSGFRAMGTKITSKNGVYHLKAKKLKGAKINLPYPSVMTTENLIIAASLAQGVTIIKNAALEPEIMDLIKMLQNMGAIIEVNANRRIAVEGVKKLHGVAHTVLPDRIEAGSLASAAVALSGDVFIKGAVQEHLITFLNALRRLGGFFEAQKDGIRFKKTNSLSAITLETEAYPGFPTDLQQPFAVLLTQAKGVSIIHETVYESRFGYTSELVKMGAKIALNQKCLGEIPCRFKTKKYKHSAVITGPTPLKATDINVPDLRAGFSYVIAALIAQGKSKILGVENIDRGYERIDDKLKKLGAKITRKSL
ncbi:UDP-N-acetylglucosamine 1-carboxyvinyltransferase [Candidatus Berkelbacteria bacterium]|nr:UDP-N-acetylglucosamine 1-carboxyvinyltransferase [Candidatus Berkelbacteria bacterium]